MQDLLLEAEITQDNEPQFIEELVKERLTYDKDGKCTNAFSIISDTEFLKQAYLTIKSNPGNMVPGTDKETLDGISSNWFDEMSHKLIKGAYCPKPARRIYIPKVNGKMRPLGIASPRDKIIQQAMLYVLSVVLEPLFLNSSHGFRPNRSCHTALREIRNWRGTPWFIEGDIKSFFDCIDHTIIENLLNKHFNDAKLIHLYWKLVKAGYVEWSNNKRTYVATDVGVPQGSILSPILSNLILHELDKFMEQIKLQQIEKNRDIKPSIRSNEYGRLTSQVNHYNRRLNEARKAETVDWDNIKILRNKLKSCRQLRHRTKSLIPNPEAAFTIEYVRYADDWIVGLWGTKKDASELKLKISEFLRSISLELSIEKTLITNTRESKANFLGVSIKRTGNNKGATTVKPRINQQGRQLRYKIPNQLMWMAISVRKILANLEEKKVLKMEKMKNNLGKTRPIPKSLPGLLVLPAQDIILRYKSILNGYINYYSFADDKPRLWVVYWILKMSLIKTLCRKFRARRPTIYRKFGTNISIEIKSAKSSKGKLRRIDFAWPKLKREPMKFMSKINPDPTAILKWKIRTKNHFNSPCASCNSTIDVEMHHIKHIKTINPKLSAFDQKVAAINRKQVPLCSSCHSLVHAGKYNGISLKYLNVRGSRTPEDIESNEHS